MATEQEVSVRAAGSGQGGWVGLRGKVLSEKRKLSPPTGGEAPVWISGKSIPVGPRLCLEEEAGVGGRTRP